MQYTGQGSEKRSYRIVLLLIVGLAAFSSAMKELNKVHEFTLQTGELIAQWTGSMATEKSEMLVKVDTCDSQIPVPPLPALPPMPPMPSAAPVVPPAPPADVEIDAPDALPPVAPPAAPAVPEVPKPRRVVRVHREAATAKAADVPEVKVYVSSEEILDRVLKDAFEADVNLKAIKAKNRRHFVISPNGDVILKSLNRSINLRAS
jgi:hypothetical protein